MLHLLNLFSRLKIMLADSELVSMSCNFNDVHFWRSDTSSRPKTNPIRIDYSQLQ